MSRPLPLTQKQITALCKGTAAAGFIAEVKIGDAVVRLVPTDNSNEKRKVDEPVDPNAFDTLDEYLAWRHQSGAGGD